MFWLFLLHASETISFKTLLLQPELVHVYYIHVVKEFKLSLSHRHNGTRQSSFASSFICMTNLSLSVKCKYYQRVCSKKIRIPEQKREIPYCMGHDIRFRCNTTFFIDFN